MRRWRQSTGSDSAARFSSTQRPKGQRRPVRRRRRPGKDQNISQEMPMETYTTIVKFFQEGGFFIYPIALVMTVGVAVAIERYIYLSRATVTNRKMWDQLMPALQGGKFPQAMSVTAKSEVAICKILNYGLMRVKSARRREDIEMAMEEGLWEV